MTTPFKPNRPELLDALGDVKRRLKILEATRPTGSGLQYDTAPQDGGWFYGTTTDTTEAGGSPNGYGWDFQDTSGGGIQLKATGANINIESDEYVLITGGDPFAHTFGVDIISRADMLIAANWAAGKNLQMEPVPTTNPYTGALQGLLYQDRWGVLRLGSSFAPSDPGTELVATTGGTTLTPGSPSAWLPLQQDPATGSSSLFSYGTPSQPTALYAGLYGFQGAVGFVPTGVWGAGESVSAELNINNQSIVPFYWTVPPSLVGLTVGINLGFVGGPYPFAAGTFFRVGASADSASNVIASIGGFTYGAAFAATKIL